MLSIVQNVKNLLCVSHGLPEEKGTIYHGASSFVTVLGI